jgi:hypothetical protein
VLGWVEQFTGIVGGPIVDFQAFGGAHMSEVSFLNVTPSAVSQPPAMIVHRSVCVSKHVAHLVLPMRATDCCVLILSTNRSLGSSWKLEYDLVHSR